LREVPRRRNIGSVIQKISKVLSDLIFNVMTRSAIAITEGVNLAFFGVGNGIFNVEKYFACGIGATKSYTEPKWTENFL